MRVCAAQIAAEWAFQAARQFGLSIPRDLSIVGFQSQAGDALDLSGPRIDFFEMGLQAARLVLGPRRPEQIVRIPALWHEGATIGVPAAKRSS